MPKPSVCVITCYKRPDHFRAVTLRRGLRETGLFGQVVILKNKHRGVLRYAEVLTRLVKIRLTKNPDVYVLTFRGTEFLPLAWLATVGKRLVYDELVNPVEWFVHEHKKFSEGGLAARLLRSVYRWLGRHVAAILTDTSSHADYSAELLGVPRQKYHIVPVCADEETFRPADSKPHDGFRILYNGTMLPLHGVPHIFEAARLLANRSDIVFHLAGGKQVVKDMVLAARKDGAHVEYDTWIEHRELPGVLAVSDLCLGGPFGGTVQSQFVVTGKTYEFLAAARPVVVGANPETKRAFTDKQNALVVPQADAKALKDAVVWAADHPKELAAIGQQGRKLYEDQFSSRRVADSLALVFRDNGILDVER